MASLVINVTILVKPVLARQIIVLPAISNFTQQIISAILVILKTVLLVLHKDAIYVHRNMLSQVQVAKNANKTVIIVLHPPNARNANMVILSQMMMIALNACRLAVNAHQPILLFVKNVSQDFSQIMMETATPVLTHVSVVLLLLLVKHVKTTINLLMINVSLNVRNLAINALMKERLKNVANVLEVILQKTKNVLPISLVILIKAVKLVLMEQFFKIQFVLIVQLETTA